MSWYCVQTITGKEIQCEHDLESKGYDCYLPKTYKEKEKRRLNDNTPIAYLPAYCFVNLTKGVHDFSEVKKISSLLKIVRLGDDYAVVPDKAINTLKGMENENGIITGSHLQYQDGEKVRFKEGHSFELREGLIRCSRKQRIYVVLNVIGKEQRIEVSPEDIEPVL